jgi:hypothetical protein
MGPSAGFMSVSVGPGCAVMPRDQGLAPARARSLHTSPRQKPAIVSFVGGYKEVIEKPTELGSNFGYLRRMMFQKERTLFETSSKYVAATVL